MVSEGEISVMMYRQVVQNVMCIHVLEGAHVSHVCVSVQVVFLCLRGDDIFSRVEVKTDSREPQTPQTRHKP